MTDPNYAALLYDVDGHVATITLNRPEVLNALNDPMRRELVAALRRAEADDDVWVVIITGAGRGFCSGADLRERAMERAQPAPQVSPERDAYPPVLREVTKPIIAAINGATRGAGCNIAFGCDFRVASESATFAVNFVERGLMGESAAYYLDRLVGRHRATEIALLGEVFSARDGERWGFINAVVPPEEVLPAARDLADRALRARPAGPAHDEEGARPRALPHAAGVHGDAERDDGATAGNVGPGRGDARLPGEAPAAVRGSLRRNSRRPSNVWMDGRVDRRRQGYP